MEERIDEICHSMRLIICIIVHFDQFLEIFTNENTMGIKIAHERERERERKRQGGERRRKKKEETNQIIYRKSIHIVRRRGDEKRTT